MAQIRLDKWGIPTIKEKKGQSSITFKGNSVVGYVPLLKIFNVLSGGNDYFKTEYHVSIDTSVRSSIQFRSGYRIFSFRRNMRNHSLTNNPRGTIVTSLLSILGVQDELQLLESKVGIRNRRRDYALTRKGQRIFLANPVDVFILAMIKPSDLIKIKLNDNNLEFDSSVITLFVSDEKYRNRKYLDENYNKNVAKYLRQSVNEFTQEYGVKVEVVPDAVLQQYYTNPYSVETNSIFEIMEIDKRVKDKVFSTINNFLIPVE